MSKAIKKDLDKPKPKLELVAIAPPSPPIAEPTQEKHQELVAIAAVPKPKPDLSNKKKSDRGDRKVLPPISPEKLKQREAIAPTSMGWVSFLGFRGSISVNRVIGGVAVCAC